MGSIKINGFASELARQLSQYTTEIAEGVKEDVDITAKELLVATKADAPKKSGDYSKAIAIKTVRENQFNKCVAWYVKDPHYRLAHLLEKGHAKRNGGRVRAYPHIGKNNEQAQNAFEERVKGRIANGSK